MDTTASFDRIATAPAAARTRESTPAPPAAASARAGVGRRFVALLVDQLAIFAVDVAVLALVGTALDWATAWAVVAPALAIAWPLAYFAAFEAATGATPGKRLLGLRVRAADGGPIGGRQALVRNLLRLVDGLPLFYLVGAILIWSTPERQRLGDRVAGTAVVRARGRGSR